MTTAPQDRAAPDVDLGRCGYEVVDRDGILGPCDRPATGWRWYQDCAHEDTLDVACEWHANEGGRRMHDAESDALRYAAEVRRLNAAGMATVDEAERIAAERNQLAAKVARVEALCERIDADPMGGGAAMTSEIRAALDGAE